MYEELVRLLKAKAVRLDYDGWVDAAVVMEKAADAIEELSRECKSLYEMFGTHPDPSGEPGDLGVLPQPPKEEK